MSIIEVRFKSIVKIHFFPRIQGVLSMGFIVLKGPAIWGEFHFRGADCLQMIKKRQQKSF